MEYRKREIVWNDDTVSQFWAHYHSQDLKDESYFTHIVGEHLVRLVKKHVPLRGKILDYATGHGHLLAYLFEQSNAEIHSCDFSPESVNHVNHKFQHESKFNPCEHLESLPSPYASESFDVIFIIETFEHLIDVHLYATLDELQRLLKPGGQVIITTPNEQDLSVGMCHCPQCGTLYHEMQHVRSFSKSSMTQLLDRYGFNPTLCTAVDFSVQGRKKIYQRVKKAIRSRMGAYRDPSGCAYPPHLVYIGTKR